MTRVRTMRVIPFRFGMNYWSVCTYTDDGRLLGVAYDSDRAGYAAVLSENGGYRLPVALVARGWEFYRIDGVLGLRHYNHHSYLNAEDGTDLRTIEPLYSTGPNRRPYHPVTDTDVEAVRSEKMLALDPFVLFTSGFAKYYLPVLVGPTRAGKIRSTGQVHLYHRTNGLQTFKLPFNPVQVAVSPDTMRFAVLGRKGLLEFDTQ